MENSQDQLKAAFAALQASLKETNVKVYTSQSPNYDDIRRCFVARSATPLGIVRPQNAQDVQLLVRACTKLAIPFTVRSGGHDCDGRSMVQDALVIDIRDICGVRVDIAQGTAQIGGGILTGD